MLSNETKLQRINEKLSLLGAKLEFACYDLKTYTPRLTNIKNPNSRYFTLYGYNLIFRTYVENNKVIFTLGYSPECAFDRYSDFNQFVTMIRTIKDIMDTCNKYELEVPKYQGF